MSDTLETTVTPGSQSQPAKSRRKPPFEPFEFNDKKIAALPNPSDLPDPRDEYFVSNSKMPGLSIRVTDTSKRFYRSYQHPSGRYVRDPLRPGEFPTLTVAAACKAVQALTGDTVRGVDHRAERAAARKAQKKAAAASIPTLGDVVDQFEKTRISRSRGRYVEGTVSAIRREYPALLSRQLSSSDSIVPAELEAGWERLEENGFLQAARVLHARVRTVSNWAKIRGPKLGFKFAESVVAPDVKPVKRRTKLSGEEARLIWQACESMRALDRVAIRVMLGTGLRYSEVVGATWDEFSADFSRWELPPHRMKGGENGHTVIVPTLLRNQISELPRHAGTNLIFTDGVLRQSRKRRAQKMAPQAVPLSGSSSLMKRLTSALRGQVKTKFVFHDFRRTTVSWLREHKVDSLVADKLLAHVTAAKHSDVAMVYQQSELLDERTEAIEWWARFLNGEDVGKGALPTVPTAWEPKGEKPTQKTPVSRESDLDRSEWAVTLGAGATKRSYTAEWRELVAATGRPSTPVAQTTAEKHGAEYWRRVARVLTDDQVRHATRTWTGTMLLSSFKKDLAGVDTMQQFFQMVAERRVEEHFHPHPAIRERERAKDRAKYDQLMLECMETLRESEEGLQRAEEDFRKAQLAVEAARSVGEFVAESEAAVRKAANEVQQRSDAAKRARSDIRTWEMILEHAISPKDKLIVANFKNWDWDAPLAKVYGCFSQMLEVLEAGLGGERREAAIAFTEALDGYKIPRGALRHRSKMKAG
jgi:integrase